MRNGGASDTSGDVNQGQYRDADRKMKRTLDRFNELRYGYQHERKERGEGNRGRERDDFTVKSSPYRQLSRLRVAEPGLESSQGGLDDDAVSALG